MLDSKFIFPWNLNFTATLWMTQIPPGNLMGDLDTSRPPFFKKWETSAVQTAPAAVRLDICFIRAESTVEKNELTAAAGQSAPVDDADDVSSMDSPELAD